MTHATTAPSASRPSSWAVVLAFALIYLSWGTTYFVIRQGVHSHHLPPGLFGGVRVGSAGLILLIYLALRGENLRLPGRELFWVALVGLILFVGGNGLITFALDRVPSGMVAVLVATTPLWMALLEALWPGGDRLTVRGWIGLLAGLAGVLLLLAPQLGEPRALFQDYGLFLVLGSAVSWSLGALIMRYRKRTSSHLVTAAYQMTLGGGGMTLIALAFGEGRQLSPDLFTRGAWFSFFYLLIVGSLVGFVAFNWLLGHVPASQVGTYAYVNPLVAILVGWLVGGEPLTGWIVGGMIVILMGVAMVRGAGKPSRSREEEETTPSCPLTRNGMASPAALRTGP